MAVPKRCLTLLLLLCAGVMSAQQSKIEHIIVVMLENRSFDHVLGFLRALDQRIEGLTGTESNPYNTSDPAGARCSVSHAAVDVDPDGGHSVEDTTEQVFGTTHEPSRLPSVAPMDGFVQNAERLQKGWGPQIMACFNKTMLPVITTLAMEFGMIDHYFSAVPGPTEVNRLYLHSATSHGDATNDDLHLAIGYPQKTLFEKLSEGGITWGSYFNELPTTLFFDFMRHPENLERFHTFPDFEQHAANGTLPQYSFVDPRYYDAGPFKAQDQHPSHSMAEGDLFLKKIYEALRLSPLWEKSLLIITYDEHGGFYDHFPTPLYAPNPDGLVSQKPAFNFTRMGVRVPMVLVSPLIEKGTLLHTPTGPTPTSQYEHSSVAATVSKLFGLTSPPLTKRDAWAGTFESVLSRTTPRKDCPLVLPNPPMPKEKIDGSDPMSPLQEGFVKLAHALLVSKDASTAPPPADMNEEQAGCYVARAVGRFLGKPVVVPCDL